MTPHDFLLFALATYYLAYALVHLDLPFDLGKRFRENVTTIGNMLLCFYCTAFWIAFALYAIHYRALDLIVISAIAGAASLAFKYTGGHHG